VVDDHALFHDALELALTIELEGLHRLAAVGLARQVGWVEPAR
jgi:hypothetical protein